MPQGRHVVESCSEEVTSCSLGAVVPIATGTNETGCIQEERGAVTVVVQWGKVNKLEFAAASARHGLRTDLLLVSVWLCGQRARRRCAHYARREARAWVLEIAEWHAWSRAG